MKGKAINVGGFQFIFLKLDVKFMGVYQMLFHKRYIYFYTTLFYFIFNKNSLFFKKRANNFVGGENKG